MAIYALGDVQGCHDELLRLIDRIAFDPQKDELWLTGDLVNRGPKSLDTLRTLHRLGHSVRCVLGNHDLHLLAIAEGCARSKPKDTLEEVLRAPDRDELLYWLRHRPLLHHAEDTVLIHAGLPPQWSTEEAISFAREVETVLRGPHYCEFLSGMYGNLPDRWLPSLRGQERLRFITNCLTRLRFCTPGGAVRLAEKGAPERAAGLIPWFLHPARQSRNQKILFGHWSTLGLHRAQNTVCLDSGCLWGGTLTAMRLGADESFVSIDNAAGPYQHPESL